MPQHRPRIVSLFPAATEIVCGLGLAEQLVAVSHACHWPPSIGRLPRVTRCSVDESAGSAAIDDQVRSLLGAGEALYETDRELVNELRPELIITQSQCDVCAVSLPAVERLVADMPALSQAQVLTLNPRGIVDLLTDVQRIADAAAAGSAGKAYAESLRRRISAVRAVAAEGRTSPPPRVAVIEWIDPLMIAGNWTPELVALAGGEYGLAIAGAASPYVHWAQIAHFGPELLVIAPCGFDEARSLREAQHLHALPGWTELPAVVSGRVKIVDGDAYFNCPGPRLVDTLELLQEWIRDVRV
jgi:iron complex transport system substrate-binding protein